MQLEPRNHAKHHLFTKHLCTKHPYHLIWGLVFILGLTACGDTPPSPSASSELPVNTTELPTDSGDASDHSAPMQGGQVVETGQYHMEFVAIPEADGIHLDFYLQTGDDHQAISGANVTAQVQLPSGAEQTLAMDYDTPGEHYFAYLPSSESGEYRVVILTEVNGEKVNSRFNFTK